MTTHADHLRNIIANRDDDLPRLVYADFLDDHGETARAEFIRVQCELARWAPSGVEVCGSGSTFDRIAAIRRRAGELLTHDHIWDWCPPIVRAVYVNTDRKAPLPPWRRSFRRGFVAEVTLSAEAWLGGACPGCVYPIGRVTGAPCRTCHGTGRTPGHADALLASTPLEVVRLTTRPRIMTSQYGIRLDGRPEWTVQELLDVPGGYGSVSRRCLVAEWPTLRFELPPAEGRDAMRSLVDPFTSTFA